MTILVERVRVVLEMHPSVLPLALPHRLTSGNGLRLSETVYQILLDAGFTSAQRERANRLLMVYLLGSIQFELYGPLSRTGASGLSKLSVDEHPLLLEALRQQRTTDASKDFLSGLTVVLDGLELSRRTIRERI